MCRNCNFLLPTCSKNILFCRFVEFSTIKEAASAIQLLHNFDIGNDERLVVKISETQEQKEARLSRRTDSLASNIPSYDDSEFDSITDDTHANPLLPQYKSLSLQSNGKPTPAFDGLLGTQRSPAGGATGLKAMSSAFEQEPNEKVCERASASPSVKSTGSTRNNDCLPCHVCDTPTFNRCSLCKTAYCCLPCQTQDWPKHQSECKLIQLEGNVGSVDTPPPPRPCTPPLHETSNGLLGDDSSDSFDELYVDDDVKYQQIKNDLLKKNKPSTNAVITPVPSAPSFESELFQNPDINRYKEQEGVPLQVILPQFDLVTRPLPSISLGDVELPKEFPVIVTAYCDVLHFSVIPASVETLRAFLKIKDFGDKSDFSPEYSTTPGTICGYKDEMGTFYRLKIIHPSSQTVEAYDTGYRAKLPFTSFFKLPDELISIPSLHKRCSLDGLRVNPEVAGGSKYLKELIDLKPVLMNRINVYSGSDMPILCCYISTLDKLIDIHGKVAVSQFCAKNMSKSRSPNKLAFGSNQSGPTASLPSTSPFGLPGGTTQNTSTPEQPLVNGGSIYKPVQYKPVQMACKVPFHCPPFNETLTIIPKVVLNPNMIWGQAIHKNFSNFHKMQADINSIYQSSVDSSYAPSVGEMCIVKFSSTQSFYRAEILCVNHNGTVDVHFVDIGNRETVSTEQLHYTMSHFLTLPKQALKFSLAGLIPANAAHNWSDAAVIVLKDKIVNRRVQVKILSVTNATLEVEMYDPEEPSLTMNDVLVQRGLASVNVTRVDTPTIPTTPTSSITGVSISSTAQSLAMAFKKLVSPITDPKQSCDDYLPSISKSPAVINVATSQNTSIVNGHYVAPHKVSPNVSSVEKMLSFNSSESSADEHLESSTKPLLPPLQTAPIDEVSPLCNGMHSSPAAKFSFPNDRETCSSPLRINHVELKNDTICQVTVTHITNPSDFWVQQLSKAAVNKLISLYDKIAKTELVPLTSVAAGDLCLCRFSEDKQIHRARVHSIENKIAVVVYLDYGNSETVPLNGLYAISSEVTLFKQLATSCTLNNLLKPEGKLSKWSESAVIFFKEKAFDKEVEMKVVRCMGRKHVVEIYINTNEGKTNIVDLFVSSGLGAKVTKPKRSDLQRNPQNNESSPSDNTPTTLQTDKKSPTEQNSGIFLRRDRLTEESCETSLSNSKLSPPPQAPVYSKVADMKVVDLCGESDVMVVEVYHPQNIVVQPASSVNAECLDKLCTSLSALTMQPSKSGLPSVGSLCCANFSQDGLWYRAQVLKHSTSGAEVYFIDYGNTETVQAPSITQCPQDIADIPVCAVKCSLNGIAPAPPNTEWPSQAAAHLTILCSEKILQAEVLSTDSANHVKNIQLFDSSSGDKMDIAVRLIKQKLAVPVVMASVKMPKISDIQQVTLPSDVFRVAISHLESPAEMFVQLATPENAAILDKFSADLNDKFSSNPPVSLSTPPAKGSFCSAKFSDGSWYRAEVLSVSGTSCEVRFVDYGNKDMVDLKNMTYCPEEFLSAPCFAICCGLAGVESPNFNKTSWTEESISQLRNLISEKLLQAKVIGTDASNSFPLLKLKDPSCNIGVSQKFVQLGYAVDPNAAKQVLNTILPLATALKKQELPTGTFALMVTEVVSPGEIYIQVATPELASLLDVLGTDLNNKFTSGIPPSYAITTPPCKGSLCCAKFSDGAWYRADVLSVSATSCEVRFIDFGNKDTIDLKCLAVLPEEFLSAPCFAICCGLAGVKSPNATKEVWPQESVARLAQLVSDKLLSAEVVNMDQSNNVPLLKLRDSADANLSCDLLEKGLALTTQKASPPKKQVVPVVKMLKKLELPTGVFQIVVSDCGSPGELYVQLATPELAQVLSQLGEDLNDKFSPSIPPSLIVEAPPSKGSLCVAKFSADGCWYRAEVLSVSGTSCEVRFVDYGNKDTVQLDNLATCPNEFLIAPCFAIQCGLAGVESPNSNKAIWPEESILHLKQQTANKLLKAKLANIHPVSNIPFLKLKDPASTSSTDLSSELIQRGFALRPAYSSPNAPTQKSPNSSPNPLATNSSRMNPSVNLQTAMSPNFNTKQPRQSLPMVTVLKKCDLPSDAFQVVVSEVVSPVEMYVQLATTEVATMLDKLSADLNNNLSSNPPVSLITKAPLVKGSLCAAKFSDGSWYRAEVLSVSGTSCEVRFIDYGNKDMVDLKNMTFCPEEFLSAPCFAIQCGLAGVESPNSNKSIWPEESILHLKQQTANKLLKAKLANIHPVSNILFLKLKDLACTSSTDLSSELIQQGFALSPAYSSPNAPTQKSPISREANSTPNPLATKINHLQTPANFNTEQPRQSPLPMATVLKKCDLPSDAFQVVVSEVVSPVEMYVQLATTEVATMLDKLSADLNNNLSSNPPVSFVTKTPLAKGSLCAAKFSDGSWYRAEVLSVSGTSCEVRFIDYGNKDMVDLKNMTFCPEEFLSAPCFAIQCGLAGVESPNSNKSIWPEESILHLKQQTANKLLKAKLANIHPVSNILFLKLKDLACTSSTDLSSELIQQGFALSPAYSSPNAPTQKSPISREANSTPNPLATKINHLQTPANFNTEQPRQSPLPMATVLKKCDLPSDAFQVVVSEVVSPVEMYVQLATTEVATMLDKLSADLNNNLSSNPPVSLVTKTPLVKGSLCAAKFSDGYWYRAEVLSVSGTICEVRFIDYGNKDMVDLKNMTYCPEEFLSAPCFAIQCGLAGVESPNSNKAIWPEKSVSHLRNMTANKLIQARVIDSDPFPSLELCDPGNSSIVSHDLIQQGYAVDPSVVHVRIPTKMELPSDTFQLIVSEAVSPAELYVQLATPENATLLDKLSTDLNDKFSSHPPVPLRTPPSKGSFFAAKFSDGLWYRAEVLSVSGTSCEVRFVDYGNTDTVQLQNMAACPEEFLSVPCFAIQCSLDSVVSPNGDLRVWPEKSISGLKQLVSDMLMKAKVVQNDTVPVVKIKQEKSVGKGDVSYQMIQQGWALDPRMLSEF